VRLETDTPVLAEHIITMAIDCQVRKKERKKEHLFIFFDPYKIVG
jgi:hypothetical protein